MRATRYEASMVPVLPSPAAQWTRTFLPSLISARIFPTILSTFSGLGAEWSGMGSWWYLIPASSSHSLGRGSSVSEIITSIPLSLIHLTCSGVTGLPDPATSSSSHPKLLGLSETKALTLR